MIFVTRNCQDVNQIQSSLHAFAAIRSDGSVVTWGKMDDGGNSSAVSPVSESGNGTGADAADPTQKHVGQGMRGKGHWHFVFPVWPLRILTELQDHRVNKH